MNATQRFSLRTIAILIMLLCSILLAVSVQGQSPEPISYTSFEGDILTLYPYSGEHIAILVPNLSYDESVLNNMVFVYDDAYSFYQQATGKQPYLYINHNGLSTIAVVPKLTCGYACGYLGATGIEIVDYGFDDTNYPQAALNKYDQTLFYELGRNFWFYSDQIEYKSPDEGGAIVTGYAVYMRFKAMDATGVTPAPFNGIPFSDFRSEVEGLLSTYLANPTFNWSNTLRVNQGVPNSMGLGGTDLFASFMFELDEMFGQDFVMRIWKEVEQRPNALTTQDAVDNFIIAASMTADTNLEGLFTTGWRWPISQQARQELFLHFGGTPLDTFSYLPVILNNYSYQPSPPEGPEPNAPSQLRLTSSSQTTLNVSWDDNSGIEDVFEVWYQPKSGGVWLNPSVAADTTNYTITGLSCGVDYTVVVRAVRWAGGNVYFSQSNFIFPATDGCDSQEGPVPNSPTNVGSVANNSTR